MNLIQKSRQLQWARDGWDQYQPAEESRYWQGVTSAGQERHQGAVTYHGDGAALRAPLISLLHIDLAKVIKF